MEYPSMFVCLMGLGTVFFGLICLIVLTMLMSAICGANRPAPSIAPPATAAPPPEPAAQDPCPEALVAAVSAALAEDLGTSITGIRILSMRRI